MNNQPDRYAALPDYDDSDSDSSSGEIGTVSLVPAISSSHSVRYQRFVRSSARFGKVKGSEINSTILNCLCVSVTVLNWIPVAVPEIDSTSFKLNQTAGHLSLALNDKNRGYLNMSRLSFFLTASYFLQFDTKSIVDNVFSNGLKMASGCSARWGITACSLPLSFSFI